MDKEGFRHDQLAKFVYSDIMSRSDRYAAIRDLLDLIDKPTLDALHTRYIKKEEYECAIHKTPEHIEMANFTGEIILLLS